MNESLVGGEGTVTVAIPGPDRPGEIQVGFDGGTETYIAYADQPVPRGARVVIFETRAGRRVGVSPV